MVYDPNNDAGFGSFFPDRYLDATGVGVSDASGFEYLNEESYALVAVENAPTTWYLESGATMSAKMRPH